MQPIRNILILSILVSLLSFTMWGCGNNVEDKIQITTTSPEAEKNFIEGWRLSDNLRFSDASKYFQKAIDLDSSFALAYYFNSFVQVNTSDARANIEKAVELSEDISEGERLLILAGDAAINNNNIKQREYLTKLFGLYPNDERIVQLYANFTFGRQEFDSAMVYYNRVVELNDKYPPPYNQLGYIYRYKGRYDDAEKAFKKYIELIPNDPNPYDSYAEMLMRIGKYGLSIETYYKALEIDPSFMPSHTGIAYNLCLLDKHKDARAQLKEMFQNALNDAQKRQALFAEAVTYVDEGKILKAIKQIQKQYNIAAKIHDTASMSNDLVNEAFLLGEIGMYDKAEEKYKQSEELLLKSDYSEEFKESIKLRGYLMTGRFQRYRGEYAESKKNAVIYYEASKTAENPFNERQAHQLLGWIALGEKNYELALEEFSRADLRNPYVLYLMGNAYEGLEQIEKALEFYEKAAHFNSYTTTPINYALIRKKAELKLLKLSK